MNWLRELFKPKAEEAAPAAPARDPIFEELFGRTREEVAKAPPPPKPAPAPVASRPGVEFLEFTPEERQAAADRAAKVEAFAKSLCRMAGEDPEVEEPMRAPRVLPNGRRAAPGPVFKVQNWRKYEARAAMILAGKDDGDFATDTAGGRE